MKNLMLGLLIYMVYQKQGLHISIILLHLLGNQGALDIH